MQNLGVLEIGGKITVPWPGQSARVHMVEGKGGPITTIHYVIALVISFPKWAHLSPNSQRRPRYDATKLGTTRAILAICIGKMGKNPRKKFHGNRFLEPLGGLMGLKSGIYLGTNDIYGIA